MHTHTPMRLSLTLEPYTRALHYALTLDTYTRHSNYTPMHITWLSKLFLLKPLRTNNVEASFVKHAMLLKQKLMQFGYPGAFLDECYHRRRWVHRSHVCSGTNSTGNSANTTYVIPFKVMYFDGAERLSILTALRKHALLIGDGLKEVKRCWMTSPNLFRIRYNHFF